MPVRSCGCTAQRSGERLTLVSFATRTILQPPARFANGSGGVSDG